MIIIVNSMMPQVQTDAAQSEVLKQLELLTGAHLASCQRCEAIQVACTLLYAKAGDELQDHRHTCQSLPIAAKQGTAAA